MARPICQLLTRAIALFLLPDEAALEEALHRVALVAGPEAEGGRAPQPLALEAARLGAGDLHDRLARRAGGAVRVGEEPLAHHLAQPLLARGRVGHQRRLQPPARGALVAALAEHRLIVRVGILREPVDPHAAAPEA